MARTGRPPKPETPYKVRIHKNGTRRYASTQIEVVGADGKKKYKYKHWGSIDEENNFHPNLVYLTTPESERKKLIFPEEIHIPKQLPKPYEEIVSPSEEEQEEEMDFESEERELQYGPTWFLEQVADASVVREDLMRMFNDDRELVSEILTYAYYFFTLKPRPDVSVWQQFVWAPAKEILTIDAIFSMLDAITPEHEMSKFRCLGVEDVFMASAYDNIRENYHATGFVSFVHRALNAYLNTVRSRSEKLMKEFEYAEDIVDKFRPIHCFMRKGEIVSITPFNEEQLELCKIFGLRPPKE